jgi:hypothetical protein
MKEAIKKITELEAYLKQLEEKRQKTEAIIELHCREDATVSVSTAEPGQKVVVHVIRNEGSSIYTPVSNENIESTDNRIPVVIHQKKKKIVKPRLLTMVFTGDERKFRNVVHLFCKELGMLRAPAQPGDLCDIFLSKDITPGSQSIYLDCDTNVFQYIVISLKGKWFKKLNFANIERTGCFYNKERNPITANMLSLAYRRPIEDPKVVRLIDSITKQMY